MPTWRHGVAGRDDISSNRNAKPTFLEPPRGREDARAIPPHVAFRAGVDIHYCRNDNGNDLPTKASDHKQGGPSCERHFFVVLLGLFSVLALSARVRADDDASSAPASGDSKVSPEDFLKSKGLKCVGQAYVLPDEAALTKKFRDLNPLKRKVVDVQKKSDAAEKKVQDKKDLMGTYTQKRREVAPRKRPPGTPA